MHSLVFSDQVIVFWLIMTFTTCYSYRSFNVPQVPIHEPTLYNMKVIICLSWYLTDIVILMQTQFILSILRPLLLVEASCNGMLWAHLYWIMHIIMTNSSTNCFADSLFLLLVLTRQYAVYNIFEWIHTLSVCGVKGYWFEEYFLVSQQILWQHNNPCCFMKQVTSYCDMMHFCKII